MGGRVTEMHLSCHPYHTILHMRTPNFLFSVRTSISTCQPLSSAIFTKLCTAAWVLIHKMNTEEPVTMCSQFTTIRTPSGQRSCTFSIPCRILIFHRTVYNYYTSYREVHMRTFTKPHSNVLSS